MSVRLLEEMSTPALDALDRARTVVVLTVSPLEEHGPHLPVGVDAIAARHFAEALSERLTAARPGWTALLAPTLPLGSFTFEAVGTVSVRQRVVRDAVVDYGRSFARAGFRYILVANGHGGPGHLTALEEASAIVSRRHRVTMASLSGHLAWQFLRGRYVEKIAAALGRPLSDDERKAFSEDAHGGWWETSLMLLIRPDLVDPSYRTLPPARYSLPERAVPNFPAAQRRSGLRGPPGAGRSGVRQGRLRSLDGRDDADGGRTARRPHPSQRRAFAVLHASVLQDGFLADRHRHRRHRARRGGRSDPRRPRPDPDG